MGHYFLAKCALHAIFVLHSKSFQLLSKYLCLQADFLQSEKGGNIGKVSS